MSGRIAAVALLLLLTPALLLAQPAQRVQFQKGKSAARIEGSVLRGERARHVIGARAGQTMTVTIRSAGNNAVLSVYRQPKGTSPDPAGLELHLVPATRWSARLAESGDYVVLVGGTRGNATYTLDLEIR